MDEPRDKDAVVWRRAKDESAMNGAFCRPEPLVLAAYVEARADDDEVQQVEAWLASDPEAPTLIASLRGALRNPQRAAEVPPASIARAQAIVRGSGSQDRAPRPLWGHFPVAGLQWSALAAFILFVAVAGFEVGRSGGAALTEEPEQTVLSVGLAEPGDSLL